MEAVTDMELNWHFEGSSFEFVLTPQIAACLAVFKNDPLYGFKFAIHWKFKVVV